jgi:hypothetical protein
MNPSTEIEKRIDALEEGRRQLDDVASNRAVAMAEYDRDLAITLIQLRNDKVFELDGNTIKSPPATIMEKIAKGLVWESKLKLEHAEAKYKACLLKLEVLQTQVTACQTIYKYYANV